MTSPHVYLPLSLLFCATVLHAFPFRDVSLSAGLLRPYGRRLKYGGATVADLDGDGYADMILSHHDDRWLDLYFYSPSSKTFSRSPFRLWRDTHAITPFRLHPAHKRMHFALSQGGNSGDRPNNPIIFSILPNRSVIDVTSSLGITSTLAAQRGRDALFLSLRPTARVFHDVLFTGAFMVDRPDMHHRVFSISSSGTLDARELQGDFVKSRNQYATVCDIRGNGKLDVISYHELSIHRVTASFTLTDISQAVFPNRLSRRAVAAVAEFDFDNDGRLDLYIARATKGDLRWLDGKTRTRDTLLRNVDGIRYEDVTFRAKLSGINAHSRGVTTGDFDNDGFVDILVSRWEKPDILHRNNGDGTFSTVLAGFQRPRNVAGDMPIAFDYDQDGRLDVILSQGDWFNKSYAGNFKLLKNIHEVSNSNRFLLIRIGASPTTSGATPAASLHAQLFVYVGGSVRWVRRVGAANGAAVSDSYVETLHVGIGSVTRVSRIVVRWSDRVKQTRWNVPANSRVVFGTV